MRVLLVEDEFLIAKVMRTAFEREGDDVTIVATGEEALGIVETWKPDLVLLDMMLPDVHGQEVADQIRKRSDVPIIAVTSLGAERDRLAGFDVGVDDYVVKPFSMDELLARARAVLRRGRRDVEAEPILTFKDLVLDGEQQRVTKEGESLTLSRREFELLRMLMEDPGRLVRRADLARTIWGMSVRDAGKTLDVHMSWLRRKLDDDPRAPRYIQTVRGEGFRLVVGDD